MYIFSMVSLPFTTRSIAIYKNKRIFIVGLVDAMVGNGSSRPSEGSLGTLPLTEHIYKQGRKKYYISVICQEQSTLRTERE